MATAGIGTDLSDVAARLGIAVTRLARLLRQQDTSQLTPTARAVLGTIDREGPITLGDLAAREQVAPPTITKAVSGLEAAGYIDRIPDGDDRRVCRVALSATGRRQLDADRRRRRAWLATRISQLPDADQRKLADALDVVEQIISSSRGGRHR